MVLEFVMWRTQPIERAAGPQGAAWIRKPFYRDDGTDAGEPLALRPRQAAARLGISVSTLERLTRAGEIPRIKLGNSVLYRVPALDAWLQSCERFVDGAATNADV